MSRIAGIVHQGVKCVEREKEILSSFFSCREENHEKNIPYKVYAFSNGAYGREENECAEEGKKDFIHANGECCKNSFVLLDGYILNKNFLSRYLLEKGADISPNHSTEELLFHLYKFAGENFWEKLQGSFAFALYDGEKNTLYLVRDRLGSRNIYYFNTPEKTVFASTPRMLKEEPDFPCEIDEQSLWDFLSLQYVPRGTIFRKVRKIPAGAYAKITFSERTFCTVKKWWKADFSIKDEQSFADSCALLREKLFASVEEHLSRITAGHVPGIFLSGGVDSAIIGGIASKIFKDELKVFSMGFDESSYDERSQAEINFQYMQKISGRGEKGDMQHLIRLVPQENSFAVLERLASFYGEPYADASLLPTSLLCEFAKEEGCTLALCGDGADELFGGYERYLAMGYLHTVDEYMFPAMKKLLLASGKMLLSGNGGERGVRARGKRFLESMAKSGKERYFAMICHTKEEDKKRIAGNLLKETALSPTVENFDPSSLLEQGTGKCLKERVSELDIATYLVNDCLMKGERAAKNAYLDVRAPFLHGDILSLSLRMPYSFKEKNGYRKKILCETFADLLPPGLARRRKKGFGVPLAAFFRQNWKEETCQRLLDGVLVKKGFFDAAGIEKILQEHNGGKKDHSYLIFSLLMAELSLR